MGLYVLMVEDSDYEFATLQELFLKLLEELGMKLDTSAQEASSFVPVRAQSLQIARATIEDFARRSELEDIRLLAIFDIVLFSRADDTLPVDYIQTLSDGLANHPKFKPRVIVYSAKDPDDLMRARGLKQLNVFWKWDLLEPETYQNLKEIVSGAAFGTSADGDGDRYPVRANATTIRDLLRQTRRDDPDAPGQLLSYFAARLDRLRSNYLYPTWSADSRQDPSSQVFALQIEATKNWNELIEDLKGAAYHLWYDSASSLGQKTSESRYPIHDELKRSQIQFLANYSHLLLLLQLEAQLYLERAKSNYSHFAPGFGRKDKKKENISTVFKDRVRQYFKLLKDWDKQLRAMTGIHHFRPDRTDASRLHSLAKAFAPENAGPLERGWQSQTDEARKTLWYEYNRALKNVNRRAGKWKDYAILAMENTFTGYGVRPMRFVGAFAATIVVFSLFFFADDLILGTGACNKGAITLSIDNIMNYLIASFSSLAGRSTGAHPCGWGADILTSLGAFAGYFLLAVLASLLYQLLNSEER